MEFVGALIVTLVAAPVLRRVALRRGFVDRPGPLKTHRAPVPYLGGVAVFLGLVVGRDSMLALRALLQAILPHRVQIPHGC